MGIFITVVLYIGKRRPFTKEIKTVGINVVEKYFMARWLPKLDKNFDLVKAVKHDLSGSWVGKKYGWDKEEPVHFVSTNSLKAVPVIGEIMAEKQRKEEWEYGRNKEICRCQGGYGRYAGYNRGYRRYPSRNYARYGYSGQIYNQRYYKPSGYQRKYQKTYSWYGQGNYYRAYGTKRYGRRY